MSASKLEEAKRVRPEATNRGGCLDEPMTALRPLEGLVVIDEVQRFPDLFPVLRVLADRRGRPARFLILPQHIPAEVETKALSFSALGRLASTGPGKVGELNMDPYAHEKVEVVKPASLLQLFVGSYYYFLIETLLEGVRPATDAGEQAELPILERSRPNGSTADVSFWTSRDVREVQKSHLNYVVADTRVWEQAAAYEIDRHPSVDAFVKNAGLGFAIPYLHNGDPHDFIPDFVVRYAPDRYLILETKRFDPTAEVKRAAALRWTAAVNAHGSYGELDFKMPRELGKVRGILDGLSG